MFLEDDFKHFEENTKFEREFKYADFVYRVEINETGFSGNTWCRCSHVYVCVEIQLSKNLAS